MICEREIVRERRARHFPWKDNLDLWSTMFRNLSNPKDCVEFSRIWNSHAALLSPTIVARQESCGSPIVWLERARIFQGSSTHAPVIQTVHFAMQSYEANGVTATRAWQNLYVRVSRLSMTCEITHWTTPVRVLSSSFYLRLIAISIAT